MLLLEYNESLILFFFNKDFIYLLMRETHTEIERQRHRQREKQAPCREPDVGLDPGSPGSGAKPLSHLGCPNYGFLKVPASGLQTSFVNLDSGQKAIPEAANGTVAPYYLGIL